MNLSNALTEGSSNFPFGGAPYDESRAPDGTMRSHWTQFFERLEALGEREARTRWSHAKQLIVENGATYNIYGDTSEKERPWRLSPIPVLIGPNEWRHLSRGIAQRARLLSLLLSDLYGPQRTLMDGGLPSELVFDNPNFLRAVHGLGVSRNNWLPIYAVDLTRAPNGEFLALEDFTQAATGMGYALENRIVVSQVLPDLIRQCNVERLASFFRVLREQLQGSAPHNRDAPRIALLTPGPYSASYYEQSYLAKYLGIPLVQGEDLAVRDDRIYLKTLGGLLPVDVLLRRVFDTFCDPLELKANSTLGIPGLVQAVRSGNVNTVNPLGTGLLETPAFQAYLPAMCRRLLNEDLALPSVPTYYCGDPAHLEVVASRLREMVIKPTFATERSRAIFVHTLDANEQDALLQRILATPHAYVAQRFIPSSKTPVIVDGGIRSRAFILRCFATCAHPADYHVMPGGLALVANTETDLAVSLQHGARSKDVWVVSDEPVDEDTVVPPSNQHIVLSRGGGDLPSRVADNLYWLGRYTERAEGLGRLARVIGAQLTLGADSRSSTHSPADLNRLCSALRAQTHFLGANETANIEQLNSGALQMALLTAVLDPNCDGSIVATIRAAMRVGRIVRDRISHDTWRMLSALDEIAGHVELTPGGDSMVRLVSELNQIVSMIAGFSGLVMDSMTRGFAWRFLDMGRRLERGTILVTLLRATLSTRCEREVALLEAVLDVADSSMTYRRRYPTHLQVAPAVDLLLADDTNPRSVAFQLKTLANHIGALPSPATNSVGSRQQRLILSATSAIELSDIDELCRTHGDSPRRDGLAQLLQQLETQLPALSDSLTETYLYHANTARHLRRD